MSSISILAPAIGPLMGSLILKFAGWRSIFGLLACSGIISLLLLAKIMPETCPSEKQQKLEMRLLLKNYGFLFSHKLFLLNTLAFCMFFGALIAWLTAGTFLTIDTFHFSPQMFGVFQAIVFGGFMIGTKIVNRFVEKRGADHLITKSLILTTSSSGMMFLLGLIWPQCFIGFVALMAIFACGAALAMSPLNRLSIEAGGDIPMGSRVAVFSTLMSIMGVLASIVAGFITTNQTAGFLPLAIIMVIAALVASLIRRLATKK